MTWTRLYLTLAGRSLLNPRLAVDLLRLLWRFRHRHWYKQFPYFPLPADSYMRWRMYTAYGDEKTVPPPDDIVAYATWLRTQP